MLSAGNTKGGSITVPLTSCLTSLDQTVLQIKTKIISSHTADSKPVKQEVNSTMILPPLVFPAFGFARKYQNRVKVSDNDMHSRGLYYKMFYNSNCCCIVIRQSVCHCHSLPPLEFSKGLLSGRLQPCLQILGQSRSEQQWQTLADNNTATFTVIKKLMIWAQIVVML